MQTHAAVRCALRRASKLVSATVQWTNATSTAAETTQHTKAKTQFYAIPMRVVV